MVVFVVALIFVNSSSSFKNSTEQMEGLSVNTEVLGNLLNKDSDSDGVLDWEEGLWNTNPYSKDTNEDGIDDKTEIDKLKNERGLNQPAPDPDTLTRTDKFSQELFTTVAALSQTGELDPTSIDQIANSIAQQVARPTTNKIYTSADISITTDNSLQTVQKYNKDVGDLHEQNKIEKGAIQILDESIEEDGTFNESALVELIPLINKVEKIITGMLEITTPSDLAKQHLDLINAMQKTVESFEEIIKFENDPLVALGGITKYQTNSDLLDEATLKLQQAIWNKINGNI